MAKRGRPRRTLENASVAVLEQALAKRRLHAEQLEAKRKDLLAALAKVDEDLAAVSGAAAAAEAKPVRRGRPHGGRRPRGALSLGAAISQVLKSAGEPMRAADVTEAVQKIGYTSRAKNFKQIVHSALTRHPEADRVGTGQYVYKASGTSAEAAPAAPRAKRGRPRGKKAAAT